MQGRVYRRGDRRSSVVQGERGRDLGEVLEPLLETEAGSSSSSELVLTGGVEIWLGDLVLPRTKTRCASSLTLVASSRTTSCEG